MLGSGAMTNSIDDIVEHADVIMLVGSNPEEAHPVIGMRIRQAVERGCRLIVVDPRRIGLAEKADIHLRVRPGTNVALANGMVNLLISLGLADEDFVNERTEGFRIMQAQVEEFTADYVARTCGISVQDLVSAVKMYGTARSAAILYCLGVTEHTTGTDGVMALSNIAMVTGNLGKPGAGMNPLRGQNNVQGACDMGAGPDDYPGYQKVWDPAVRAKFEEAWGVELPDWAGTKATECFPAMLTGGIKGLYLFGEDPVRTDPDTSHVLKSLAALDFFVVQDLFLTETAKLADVVLPGRCYAEKEGTFTNTERRVQRVRTRGGGAARLAPGHRYLHRGHEPHGIRAAEADRRADHGRDGLAHAHLRRHQPRAPRRRGVRSGAAVAVPRRATIPARPSCTSGSFSGTVGALLDAGLSFIRRSCRTTSIRSC